MKKLILLVALALTGIRRAVGHRQVLLLHLCCWCHRQRYRSERGVKAQGIKPVRFPCKTKEWFGKGILMWWEAICTVSKKRDRRNAKKQIKFELEG